MPRNEDTSQPSTDLAITGNGADTKAPQNKLTPQFTLAAIVGGLGYGSLYYITGYGGTSAVLSSKDDSTLSKTIIAIASAFPALAGGTVNLCQGPEAVKQLFSFRPDLWLSTALTFFLSGGYAAMPFAISVIQSLDAINDTTGLNLTAAKPILGNIALISGGIVFSSAMNTQAMEALTLLRAACLKSPSANIQMMQDYLNSMRSKAEYEAFDPADADAVLKNIINTRSAIRLLISFLPSMMLAWLVAPEIINAINDSKDITADCILIPAGRDFAKTTTGSHIVSLLTIGMLCALFAQRTTRVLPRFMTMSYEGANTDKICYSLFTLFTCLTGALQAKKSHENEALIALVVAFVWFINFASALNLLLGKTRVIKAEIDAGKVAQKKLDAYKLQNPAPSWSDTFSKAATRIKKSCLFGRNSSTTEQATTDGLLEAGQTSNSYGIQ